MNEFRIQRLILCLVLSVGSVLFALPLFAQDAMIGTDGEHIETKQLIYLPLISNSSTTEESADTTSSPVGVEGPPVNSSRIISETYVQVIQAASGTGSETAVIERQGTEDTVSIPIAPPDAVASDASTNSPNTSLAAAKITLGRYIETSTQGVDPPNYKARTIATTVADQCVGGIWAQVQHKYWGTGATYYGQLVSQYSYNILCFSSVQATESWILYAPGTSHIAISKHSAKINGIWQNYYGTNGQGYQSSTVKK